MQGGRNRTSIVIELFRRKRFVPSRVDGEVAARCGIAAVTKRLNSTRYSMMALTRAMMLDPREEHFRVPGPHKGASLKASPACLAAM
jgi:hypothetical protein